MYDAWQEHLCETCGEFDTQMSFCDKFAQFCSQLQTFLQNLLLWGRGSLNASFYDKLARFRSGMVQESVIEIKRVVNTSI